MKQHMTLNEQISRYLLKTDLQKDANFYAFSLSSAVDNSKSAEVNAIKF